MKRPGRAPATRFRFRWRAAARLVLFFSLCFTITLAAAAAIRFLELRIGELRAIPAPPATKLPEIISSLQWALVPALYLSVLLSLSYTSRRGIPVFMSVSCLLALSLAGVLGISLGIGRLRTFSPPSSPSPLTVSSGKGLLLSQAGMAVILLRGSGDIRGPRVVSLPGQPLIYQEVPPGPNNTALALPPLPFRNETTPFLTSLFIDFNLTAGQFETRLREGLPSLAVYAAALIFLLVSLRFVADIGSWPLEGLFLGAVAFRGVLALETFLNTPEIQGVLASFTGERIPPALTSPLIFCTLGMAVLLYTALVYLVRGGRRAGDV